MSYTLRSTMTMAAAAAILATLPATARQNRPAVTPLKPEIERALIETLAGVDGEYFAHALHSAILKKYGQLQPYLNIIEAEKRHIQALKQQLTKYGIALPVDQFAGKVTPPETLLQAAKDAVEAEKLNIARYERYLMVARDYPDISWVFTNLQRASRDAHLPAFQAASEANGQLDETQMNQLQGSRRGQRTGQREGHFSDDEARSLP